MSRRYIFVLIVVLASMALVYYPVVAKEDTAQIKLKKTAISKKNLYTYTVKKGDVISSIVRQVPGITEQDIANNYKIIRELNPNIHNINNLEVGQTIVLPGKPLTESESNESEQAPVSAEKIPDEKTSVSATENVAAEKEPVTPEHVADASPMTYKVRRGDTLYKIIRSELKVKEVNIPPTVRAIKSINPSIKNVNRIYAGTLIKLPGETVFVKTPEDIKPVSQDVVATSDKAVQPAQIIEVKDKKIMPPEARLALLKQIVTQMNGTFTTSGNYYLPIPNAGQVTIDCAKIPLIEFDNSTVFLDLENRADNNLKKIIGTWKNYSLVKINNDDDTFGILKKILTATKTYDIIKSEKPLTIGTWPTVEIMVDWLIVKPIPKQQSKAVVQGLRPIEENSILLPKSVKNYAQRNGLFITEFSEATGIVGKPDEIYSLPSIPVFPTTSARDFSFALVTQLGLSAQKEFDIQLFDTVRDGFNLSLKADVLVNKDNKKYVIYSQPLSQQFINALKQAGNEPIFVSDSDSPKTIMESVLGGLEIPFSYEHFVFSGPEKNQAPYVLKFTGTKINQDLYVVGFDIDSELRGLLQEVWSVKIARY